MPRTRIAQLDGVRGIAIGLVLVWHYFNCSFTPASGVLFQVRRATSLSWSGVDLFFVLSGFLIGGILMDSHDRPNRLRVFYLRRVCRIFPLYFLSLIAFVVVGRAGVADLAAWRWLFQESLPVWSYATFTQNIVMGTRGTFGAAWLGITWSLAVEEQFYLLMPVLIYFLPRRPLLFVLGIAIVAAPALRHFYPGFHAQVWTPWREDSLLSGVVLSVLVRVPGVVERVQRYSARVTFLLVGLVAGVAFMTLRPNCFGAFDISWLAATYTTLILIAFAGGRGVLDRLLTLPTLVWLGRHSYGIYMFHQLVGGVLFAVLRSGPPRIETPSDGGIAALALCITLALAAVSSQLLEEPILRLGHRLRYAPVTPLNDAEVEPAS